MKIDYEFMTIKIYRFS